MRNSARWNTPALDRLTAALALVLAPMLLFPRRSWLPVLLAVPVVAGLRWLRIGQIAPPTPLSVPIVLLLAMAALSAWTTPSLDQSLGKLTGIALGGLVFWGIIVFAATARRLLLVIAGLGFCGMAIALASLVGTTWETKLEVMRPVVAWFPVRWKGLPGAEEGFNANPVGATMTWFIVGLGVLGGDLLSGRLGEGQRRSRVFGVVLACGAALMGGVLLLSQSRGAWLGLLAGAVAAWWIGPRSTRARVGVLASSAVLMALIAATTVQEWSRPQAPSSTSESVTLRGRVELWSRALMVVRDFPLTGMGPNIFRRAVHLFYPPFAEPPDATIPHAHNGLLQTAVDIGLPGLAAHVAVWSALLVTLARLSRRSQNLLQRHLAQGLLAGAVALAVFQITDVIPLGGKVGVLWWVVLGVVGAAHRLHGGEQNGVPSKAQQAEVCLVWASGSCAGALVAVTQPLAGIAISAVTGMLSGWLAARDPAPARA